MSVTLITSESYLWIHHNFIEWFAFLSISYSLLYTNGFQVSKSSADPTTDMNFGSMLPSDVGFIPEYSGSYNGDLAQPQQSKPYLMCTATDAASAIMDFSKQKVDDDVVDSPPERRARISPVASPSPLKRIFAVVHARTDCTPQRKLYEDSEVDPNLEKVDVPNSLDCGQPSAKQSRSSVAPSTGVMKVVARPIRLTACQTQSVGVQRRLRSPGRSRSRVNSVTSRVRVGCRTGNVCRSSSLSENKETVDLDSYFKPYSRRKEIMIGYAELKAQEALRLKALGLD